MKLMIKNLGAALFLGSALSASAVTLIADDFDGTSTGALNPSGGIDLTTVTDPTDAGNMVGQIEFTGGGQWQSLLSQNFLLPAGTVPGTDSITYTYRIYIPSTGIAQLGTGFGNSDSINSLFRLNGTQPDAYPLSTQNPLTGSIPLDTWIPITNGGTIPTVDNSDGVTPVSNVTAILSVRDISNDNVAGLVGYIDDFSLDVTTSVPEPSAVLFSLLGVLGLARRKRS